MGRWGPNDEIGSLNFLTVDEVLRGVRSVKQGKVFTLAVTIAAPGGDPTASRRNRTVKLMDHDKGTYLSGKLKPRAGDLESADDFIAMYLQGTTHFDALGHVWYSDRLWNGYDAKTTIGGLEKASILPIAEHGAVGSGVLLDMARFFGRDSMSSDDTFGLDDLLACAEKQGVSIEKHDILIIRTGWLKRFYDEGPKIFEGDFNHPGLKFSKELVNWFFQMEIPLLGTDTTANETHGDRRLPLHASLLRNLGIVFNEVL